MHNIRVGARVWPVHVKGTRQWCSKSVITVKPASTRVLHPPPMTPAFSRFKSNSVDYSMVLFTHATSEGIVGYIVGFRDIVSDL